MNYCAHSSILTLAKQIISNDTTLFSRIELISRTINIRKIWGKFCTYCIKGDKRIRKVSIHRLKYSTHGISKPIARSSNKARHSRYLHGLFQPIRIMFLVHYAQKSPSEEPLADSCLLSAYSHKCLSKKMCGAWVPQITAHHTHSFIHSIIYLSIYLSIYLQSSPTHQTLTLELPDIMDTFVELDFDIIKDLSMNTSNDPGILLENSRERTIIHEDASTYDDITPQLNDLLVIPDLAITLFDFEPVHVDACNMPLREWPTHTPFRLIDSNSISSATKTNTNTNASGSASDSLTITNTRNSCNSKSGFSSGIPSVGLGITRGGRSYGCHHEGGGNNTCKKYTKPSKKHKYVKKTLNSNKVRAANRPRVNGRFTSSH